MVEMETKSIILEHIENLKSEERRRKGAVTDLLNKVFIVLDTLNPTQSVNKGLDDLAVEVCGLEAKVSILTQERDNLLHTVDNLRAEIRRLGAPLIPILQPTPMPLHVDNQPIKQSYDIHEAKTFDCQEVQQEIENSFPVLHSQNDSGLNGLGEADVKGIEAILQTQDVRQSQEGDKSKPQEQHSIVVKSSRGKKYRGKNFSDKDVVLAKRLMHLYENGKSKRKTQHMKDIKEAYTTFLAEAEQNDITKEQFRKLMSRIMLNAARRTSSNETGFTDASTASEDADNSCNVDYNSKVTINITEDCENDATSRQDVQVRQWVHNQDGERLQLEREVKGSHGYERFM